MPETIETLPDLNSDYALSDAQVAEFQQNGHVLLRGLCPPEAVAPYRAAIHAATTRYNTEQRPMEERDTYGKAFLQVMNLWERDTAVRQFTLARRFARVAAETDGRVRRPAVSRSGTLQGGARRADALAPGSVLLAPRHGQNGDAVDAAGGCGGGNGRVDFCQRVAQGGVSRTSGYFGCVAGNMGQTGQRARLIRSSMRR